MKIFSLEAENVKNLRIVRIKPDGSIIVIGGDNAEGKTCVLDCIEYGLCGTRVIPGKPIRTGQKMARIVLEIDDIVVTRTFTEKGSNLTVKNKDGATFASPQAMLDKLVGKLTFDPLEFSRMDVKEQAEVLKQLVGLDFIKVDAQYKSLFDKRTDINRRGKETKAKLDSMTEHENIPDKEISMKELGDKYAQALEHNQRITLDNNALAFEVTELKHLEKQISVLKKSIKDKKKILDGVHDIDDKSIHTRMSEAENINIKIKENIVYGNTNRDVIELRKQSGLLTTMMTKIVKDKSDALIKAKFPIKGLSIDDDGVTFEDIPFIQCSSAQKIRISVAMGLAMNPKLRVILIREGSLLDMKNLSMIAKMAEDADAQIWIERVSKGKECQVIIQDGSVLERDTVDVK